MASPCYILCRSMRRDIYICAHHKVYVSIHPVLNGNDVCAVRRIKMTEVKEGKKGKTSLFDMKRKIRHTREWAMAAK